MPNINLADAKARLSDLVERAARGETQVIMKRGKPLAKLVPIESPRQKVSLEWLESVAKDMPLSEEVVRAMRDSDRY
ncbi:MAG: type II toxin-antitoxin system Phd/YefM family antitoxin [Beijerinckiaceae bacterium]